MHYTIKKERRSELQAGYQLIDLAPLCKCSRQYLSDVFNGQRKASENFVKRVIMTIASMSVNISYKVDKDGIEETIKYFFNEIK